ncbi:MAG: glycosyltransferase [Sphingomonas sp.]
MLLTMHSLSQGGGDRVGVLLANGFASAGIPTRLALMREAGEGQAALRSLLHPDVTIAMGGPPMGLRLSKGGAPLGHQHLERLRGLKLIRGEIDSFRPAVVLAASDNMGLVTALARRPGDKAAFAMKLTNALLRPNIGPMRKFYRRNLFGFIFRRLDMVITLADAERRRLLELYPGRDQLFRTLANPYVTDEMLAQPPKPRRVGPPRLVTAGRMVPQKRFDILLRAFALLSHRDARLTCLGDGPLRPSLEALAQSLGITDRLDMPGYTADVLSRLRESDLFVLSSAYEGLPAVLIEALACNVPVVTTDSFLAARDLLGGSESCAVVPPGDPAALAEAIDRRLSLSAEHDDLRQMALPYRIDTSVAAHIAALSELVERRSDRSDRASKTVR